MTGKRRMPRKHHPACYQQSRRSKRPILLFNATCLEYVRVDLVRLFFVALVLLIFNL